MSEPFVEQPVLLGPRQSLVGIVTRPASPPPLTQAAVIILNTGIVHRVGHHRMYVTLARQLASAGRTVLRFDFSGIGDSDHRPGRLSPIDACMADLGETLDSMEKAHCCTRFVLVGLCAGADHAVLYGHRDPRVEGLVLLDPTLPPTTRYYFHYVVQRLTSLRNWASVVTGRSGLLRLFASHLRHGIRGGDAVDGLSLDSLQFSPYLAECYRGAAEHGLRLLVAFTSVSPRQTYRQQMLDAFPALQSSQRLTLEYFPSSDHLFSAGEDRARLGRLLLDWLAAGAEPAPPRV